MSVRADIETNSSRIVYENQWMRVREDEISRRDGSRGIYGVVEKPDFAVIVPVEDDSRLHLVEQFRYPVDRLASELGEPIAPDLLDSLIAQNLQPGSPPPELGVAGSGQDLRGLLLNAIVAMVIQAYTPEINEGREALQRGLYNLNAHIAQMVTAGEQHLADHFEPAEIRAAVQRGGGDSGRGPERAQAAGPRRVVGLTCCKRHPGIFVPGGTSLLRDSKQPLRREGHF